MTGFILAKVL